MNLVSLLWRILNRWAHECKHSKTQKEFHTKGFPEKEAFFAFGGYENVALVI
jgi:hypothetical protein